MEKVFKQKKVFTILLSILTLISMLTGLIPEKSYAADNTGTILSVSANYWQGNKIRSSMFKVSKGSMVLKGYCAEHSKDTASKGSKIRYTQISNNDARAKVWYYSESSGATNTEAERYKAGIAMSIANGDTSGGFWKGTAKSAIDAGRSFYNQAQKTTVPSGVRVYYGQNVSNSHLQSMVVGIVLPKFKVKKVSKNPELTDGNKCYSLKDAEFTIYKNNSAVGKIQTIDEQGNTNSIGLEAGSYTLKETRTPKGYLKCDDVNFTMGNSDQTITVQDPPNQDPMLLKLFKKDKETGKEYPLGNASLENAEFKLEYFDNENKDFSGTAKKTWVFKTNKRGRILFGDESQFERGDSLYKYRGEVAYLIGSYRLTEVKPPIGYLNNDNLYDFVLSEDKPGVPKNMHSLKVPQDYTHPEQVKRGGFRFNKIKDGKYGTGLPDIPFEVISKTTGEKHVIVSDKNGVVDTEAVKDPAKANLNDKLDVDKVSSENGIWFSGTIKDQVAPNTDKMALPYDTYEIKELRCKANKGLKLADFTITVEKDSYSIDRGTVTDDKDIDIKSELKDEHTKLNITSALNTSVTINDKIWFRNAEQDSEYIIRGELVDKDNPDTIVAKSASEKFTCWTSDGKTKVQYKFDATKYRGKKLVSLQTMYEIKDGKEVKVAEDRRLENPSQTISIPDIGTEAAFAEIDTIVDTVSYKNLIPGKEYTMKASLVDKDGKETGITAEAKFTPEKESGTVDVTLKGKNMAGKTFVVYEELWYGKTQLVDHKDTTDKKQTVKVPEIKTEARDQKDGDKAIMGEANQIITDTLTYKNLTPGKKYTIEENLADPNTGKLLIDEKTKKPVVATKEFTPEKEDGQVSIDIAFDATKQQAQKVVAFAKIIEVDTKGETRVIAQHLDKDDPKQQVDVYMELFVSIAKGDAKKENYRLKGAEITIFDEKGNIVKDKDGKDCVGVTDENGEVKFTILYLKDNNFYAQETKAPSGYHLNKNKFPVKPKTFSKEGADIKISILDEAIIIPPAKTGDTNNLLIALCGLGLASGGLFFVIKRKKKQK